jgi:hypothetical protein
MSMDQTSPQDKPPRWWFNLLGHAYDYLKTPAGRIQLGLYLGIGLILFACGGLLDRVVFSPLQITPASQRFGWDERSAKTEAPRIAALMPKFAITDPDGNVVSGAGKNAELWKFARMATKDQMHIPTWKQESGDCVSMGWSNAIAYRMAFQIAQEQRNEILKIPFPPYMYAISRVQIGKRQLGRGAGSVGAWAAQGSQAYGVLPVDKATDLGFLYSGSLADAWGWQGPPAEAIAFASKFRIRTVSQVRSWEDVRDALTHGYPVTVASNVGFNGQFVEGDGKRWGTAYGKWGHQMCFIGAEDRPHRNKGAYVINSWGADAHPKPLNDEPPGGFWVKWQDVQRMVQQNDSWAYSDFDGFPAEAVADWNKFKARASERDEQAELAAVEQPAPEPVLMEVRQMFATSLLLCGLCLGFIVLAYFLRVKYNQRCRGILSLMLACSLIGMGTSAEAEARGRSRRFAEFMPTQSACVGCASCPNGSCANGLQCANGSCSTGVKLKKPADPNAGLPPEMRMSSEAKIELASTGDVPVEVWNAFQARAQKPAVQVWNALEPSKKALRSYRDCHDTEKDFVLVVGSKDKAEMQLLRSTRPIAFEESIPGLDAGEYRVFEVLGLGLRIERLNAAVGSLTMPRSRK